MDKAKRIEVRHDTGFGTISREIFRDNTISVQAKSIYGYLCSFAGVGFEAYPSVSLIIHELNMSKNTFYKYMNELKEREIIEVKRLDGEGGKFGHNIYRINSNYKKNVKKKPCTKNKDMVKSTPCLNLPDMETPDMDLPDMENEDTNINSFNINSFNINNYKNTSKSQSEEEAVISNNFKNSLIKEWNSIENIPNIKSLRSGTKRYNSLKARLEEFSEEEILQAIINIKKSYFLQGKNNRGWTISFDWFVKPNNFIKVLENQYKNNEIENNIPAAKANKKESWIDEDMEAEMKRILGD